MSLRVACIQFRSSQDVDDNCARARHLIQHICREQPDVVLLPDHVFFMGPLGAYHAHAHPIDAHPWLIQLQKWAAEFNTVIVTGTIPERAAHADNGKVFQTAAAVFPSEPPQFIRKRMLLRGVFRGQCFDESSHIARGEPSTLVLNIKGWRIGIALCVELRYASIFHSLRYEHNCDLALIPASFYYATGQSHWLTLLQARAIEFQLYVAAANQSARPDESTPVFCGQSTIIDPWGVPMSVASVVGDALCLQDIHKEKLLVSRVRIDTAYNIHELQQPSEEVL